MPAQAATLVLSGGTHGTIPGGTAKNDALKALSLSDPLAGWYGTQVFLSGKANVTFTRLGAEAGYTNTVLYGAQSLTDPGGGSAFDAAGYDSFSVGNVMPGLLGFSFYTSGGKLTVKNGANPDSTNPKALGINFFATFLEDTKAKSGRSLLLFFDDDGAQNDDDYDDLVVRVDVAAVPLPAAGLLLAGALAGLGALRRRRG